MKRDYQKSKVQLAIREWRKEMNESNEMDLSELSGLLRKIVSGFRPDIKIQVKDGRGPRNALWWRPTSGSTSAVVSVPRRLRTLSMLCELAAHIVVASNEAHGPEFCRKMLAIVRGHMGPLESSRLVACYQRAGVLVSEAQESHHLRKRATHELLSKLHGPIDQFDHEEMFKALLKMTPEKLAMVWASQPLYIQALEYYDPDRWETLRIGASSGFGLHAGTPLSNADRSAPNR